MINTEFSNNQNERTTSKFSILALGISCTRYNFFHINIGIFVAHLLMFTQMVNGSHIKSYIGAMH